MNDDDKLREYVAERCEIPVDAEFAKSIAVDVVDQGSHIAYWLDDHLYLLQANSNGAFRLKRDGVNMVPNPTRGDVYTARRLFKVGIDTAKGKA